MKRSKLQIVTQVVLTVLCLAPVERLTAQVAGSLKNLDLEKAKSNLAVDSLAAENKQLRNKLAISENSLSALQRNFGIVSSEAEVFRRKAAELNARLEAIGTGKLDDRLLKLLSELKTQGDSRAKMQDALIGLTEAVRWFERKSATEDPGTRAAVETAMRDASKALGIAPAETPSPAPIPSTLTDGMVVSVKEDLALIIANVGSRHGVKVGMPFEVIRKQVIIGTVRVVDVRDKISGALIQNLIDKETVKVGDRLRVAAQ